VLVSGEGLQRGPIDVLGTLLHEAAHGLAHACKISDTSRQGRYHNRRYATLARELGLEVAHMQPIGWSATSVPSQPPPAASRCWPSWPWPWCCGDAPSRPARLGRAAPATPWPASCACGRRIRVARSVLEQAPILCGACAQPFEPKDDELG
jgi:hypothetical protein